MGMPTASEVELLTRLRKQRCSDRRMTQVGSFLVSWTVPPLENWKCRLTRVGRFKKRCQPPHTCGDGVHFEYYLKSSSQLPPLKTNERAKGSPSGRNLPLLQGKRH